MKTFYFMLIPALLFIACKKEPVDKKEPVGVPCFYATYSTDSFERVFKQLFVPNPGTSQNFSKDRFIYSEPVFNPSNPYEIAYLRTDTSRYNGCERELWKFSFCTGKASRLAERVCYSPHWSSKGWIIYTGVDRQLWKVKDNGDSLTQLTNKAGFNNHAKWSPDGKLYAYQLGDGSPSRFYIVDSNGKIREIQNFYPVNWEWLNNDSIIANGYNSFYILDITTGIFSTRNNDAKLNVFDPDKLFFYYFKNLGPEKNYYWVRFDLNTESTDPLRPLYDSYMYGEGDYAPRTGKVIIQLARADWKDSIYDQRYGQSHLLLMNPDGTDERLVQIPE